MLTFLPRSILAQAPATLHVRILDNATGTPVPALVCITSLEDGSWRVPPDGRVASPAPVTGAQQIAGWAAGPGEWHSGEPGPIRLTRNTPIPGITMSQRQRGAFSVYNGASAIPYWNEPVAYFIDKPFTITLPPGRWHLAVEHGPEYLPQTEEIDLTSGQTADRDVRLRRWVNMPALGWYSGDPEFHDWRNKPWRNDFILTWARAQDTHMVSILSFSQTLTSIGNPQPGYGPNFRFQRGDYALASGHEGPRTSATEQGHLMQLNINAVVRYPGREHLMDAVCDGVHAQHGLCGYAHLAWADSEASKVSKGQEHHGGWDASINTIREKIDFMEILQYRQLGTKDFYDFLNMGVRLTALAASDVTGGATLGESVTYAYTGTHFSPDAWYKAVKLGHTFVTNGPMLLLSVNGSLPGDTVRLSKPGTVHIDVKASSPAEMGSPEDLEVIAEGKVIKTVPLAQGKQSDLSASFDLPVTESKWLVARVKTSSGGVAHTSPVYVVVRGASFADKHQLSALVAERLEVLDFIEKRLNDSAYVHRNEYSDSEIPLLLQSVKAARSRYQEVLRAGGVAPNAPRQ